MRLQELKVDVLGLLSFHPTFVAIARHAAGESSLALRADGFATPPTKGHVLRPRARAGVLASPGVERPVNWWAPSFAVEAGACPAPDAPWQVHY